MRSLVLASLVLVAACGAESVSYNVATPIFPAADAPTAFTRAYSMTESRDGLIRVYAKEDGDYTKLWEMRKQEDGSWSDPQTLDFPSRITLTTPSFSASDGALYYASDADIFERGQRDLNIWRVEATPEGWGEPEPLPASINDGARNFNPAMDANGHLYFTSDGYDSIGGHDIFEAVLDEETGDWAVSTMPDGVNSPKAEGHLAVTPDGNRMFFYSHRAPKLGVVDIWTMTRGADGNWQMPENLGEPVNTAGIDFGAGLSGDGSRLFFSRDGELMIIDLEVALAGEGSVSTSQ
ncbi:TolB family protein [Henriciella litoralis]|uniref:TolB family protein n=1 Tax=Henriciella litoralis TaxID=568102 RepID=UPI00146F67E7|nr:PD40 domain-containing protein [Henriciella litoralis]